LNKFMHYNFPGRRWQVNSDGRIIHINIREIRDKLRRCR
jgi:hypothetical protein